MYNPPMTDRLEQLHKLHAADPDDADITYMIAMEHTKPPGNDPAAVIDWLNKTLDLDPNYLYAYFQKAKALSELGQADAAKATLQLGIQHATEHGDAKAQSELSELMASLT